MNYKVIVTLVAVLMVFGACSDKKNINAPNQTIHGSGDLVSETRQLSGFNSIIINTVAYVRITQGASQEVVVTSDDNIIEYISTRVHRGVLYISIYQGVSISDFTLELDLTISDMEAVIVNSVATVLCNDVFNCDYMFFEMNSVGHIIFDIDAIEVFSDNNSVGTMELSGSAITHNVKVSSVGYIRAFELETDTTIVEVNSVGNAYVRASDYLRATINDMGSIYYRGYPEIDLEDNGTGRLIDSN
jgi:hypothetical protein